MASSGWKPWRVACLSLRREQLAVVDVLSDLRGQLVRLQEDGQRAQAAAERSVREAGEARRQCETLAEQLSGMDAAQKKFN